MINQTKKWQPLAMILICATIWHTCAKQGIIVMPVADVVGEPLQSFALFKQKKQPYNDIPFAYSKDPSCCPRIHQLLFNERVEILKAHKDELLVEVSHFFYVTKSKPRKKNTRFWINKNAVIPLSQLSHVRTTIPEAISFERGNFKPDKQNVMTLNAPFYDPTTQRTFSAGTRFVYLPQKTTRSVVAAHAFNPHTNTTDLIKIPRKYCVFYHDDTTSNLMHNFVRLLKKWTHNNRGLIPYVLGGCSLTSYVQNNEFSEVHVNSHMSFYDRKNYTHIPKTGFDCAGLLLRAAHICGIPLFCKNTTTLAACLKPLQKNEDLVAGDLILHRGHVLAISDIKKNLVIEARGYGHGYGKVQEMPLKKIFKGIDTLHKLREAYTNGTTLLRLDSAGNTVQKIVDLKILKLASVWQA